MANNNKNLTQIFGEKEIAKLNALIEYDGIGFYAKQFRQMIEDRYTEVFEASSKLTIRQFFQKYIAEFAADNIRYKGGKIIRKEIIDAVSEGLLEGNISGFVQNCKNADALIFDYKIERDVPTIAYGEFTQEWSNIVSTVVWFRTSAGKFVYISGLNTIKTESLAEKYFERVKLYYSKIKTVRNV